MRTSLSWPGEVSVAGLFRNVSAGVVCAAACLTAAAVADDWPTWRGPKRDGHSRDASGWTGGAWLAARPLWIANLGEGCSSPVVVKGRFYSLGWHENHDHLVCRDATSGKVLWRQSYRCPRYGRHHLGDENAYSGPTATPEFDTATSLLYTLSTDGDLACWDTAAEGRRVWGFNLYATYGVPRRPEVGKAGSRRDYGYITAPQVHRDWLVVAVGARDGHLMAFDKRTGQCRWRSESTEPAGHCGGLSPIDIEGIPCLASLTLRKLLVIRLDESNAGKTLAAYDWVTDYGNNIATPAVHGQHILLTSAYNHRAMCKLEVSRGGIKKLWEVPHASGACSPVIHDGHVYWAWERLHCLDLANGKLKWQGGSYGSPGSCIVTADGKLIVWADRGKLVLLQPGDRYQELSRARIFETHCWPHVVLADGRLYCKDRAGNVKCFTVQKEISKR